jgi:hypothetical protein
MCTESWEGKSAWKRAGDMRKTVILIMGRYVVRLRGDITG